MAKDGFGEIIGLVALAGGAYVAWNWWSSQTAAAATPVTPVTPANPAVYVPPTAMQQMQAAAQSNSIIQGQGGQADAYQWATLWQGIGKSAIPNVNALFFPNGLPANAAAVTSAGGTASTGGLPLMTLAAFMSTINGAGISGLGQVNGKTLIPVPIIMGGRTTTVNVPRGTTPAMLQQVLRRGR